MGRPVLRDSVLHTGLRTVLEEVCERDLEAELKRLSMLDGGALRSRTARSRGSQSGLAVLHLTSLPSPLRSPAPPLNGFRRLGSRQSGKRLSCPRHWLQPTAVPARSSRGYGLLWLRRSRDNRGRERMATESMTTKIIPNDRG